MKKTFILLVALLALFTTDTDTQHYAGDGDPGVPQSIQIAGDGDPGVPQSIRIAGDGDPGVPQSIQV